MRDFSAPAFPLPYIELNTKMKENLVSDFITRFCKVEFLCYEGEPNWLGLLVLILFLAAIIAFIFGGLAVYLGEWDNLFFKTPFDSLFKRLIIGCQLIVALLGFISFITISVILIEGRPYLPLF